MLKALSLEKGYDVRTSQNLPDCGWCASAAGSHICSHIKAIPAAATRAEKIRRSCMVIGYPPAKKLGG
jgi:hypothetical protein